MALPIHFIYSTSNIIEAELILVCLSGVGSECYAVFLRRRIFQAFGLLSNFNSTVAEDRPSV